MMESHSVNVNVNDFEIREIKLANNNKKLGKSAFFFFLFNFILFIL